MRKKEFNHFGVKEQHRVSRLATLSDQKGVYDISAGGVVKRRKDTSHFLISCAGVGRHGSYVVCVGAHCVDLRPSIASQTVEFKLDATDQLEVEVIGMVNGYQPVLCELIAEESDGQS